MVRPTLSPNGTVRRWHFSAPPEMTPAIEALAKSKKLSKACQQGIKIPGILDQLRPIRSQIARDSKDGRDTAIRRLDELIIELEG